MNSYIARALHSLPRRPPNRPYILKASITTATTAALGFTMYNSTVVRSEQLNNDFEDDKSHHVKNCSGKTVKFRNPHPSAKVLSFTEVMSVMT